MDIGRPIIRGAAVYANSNRSHPQNVMQDTFVGRYAAQPLCCGAPGRFHLEAAAHQPQTLAAASESSTARDNTVQGKRTRAALGVVGS